MESIFQVLHTPGWFLLDPVNITCYFKKLSSKSIINTGDLPL